MTTTLTKADLATKLAAAGQPLTASQIKNTTIADLTAMVDVIHVDNVQMPGADVSALPGDATPKQVKAVRVSKPAKARALFMRKPGREAKTYKAGTRRAEIALALLKGATIDDMRAICVKASGEQWSKNATRAALTTFQVNNGFGIEERDVDGVRRFFLIMPAGMESPVA